MYLIRVQQQSSSYSNAVRGPRQLIPKSDDMVFSCDGSSYLHESWAGNSMWIHRTPNECVKHGLGLLFSLPATKYLSCQLILTEPGRIRENRDACKMPWRLGQGASRPYYGDVFHI
jgi:hypothetical protein